MEQENKVKNYLLSNKQILDILTSDNKDSNWAKDDFYAISGEYINYWKSLINFDQLCENININDLNNMKNLNIDEKNKNYIDDSFNSSVNKIDDIFGDFELISRKALESFVKDYKNINFRKILTKKGMRKIIIKENENENSYIILYLDKNKEKETNFSNKDIAPNKLDKYLNYLSIKIQKEPKKDLMDLFIDEIIKSDIYDWVKKNKFNTSNKVNIFKEISFTLNKKDKKKEIPNLYNISSIKSKKNELIISKSTEKSLINNLSYINTTVIKRIKNRSFIIASMSSLSQINDLAEYFLSQKSIFNNCSELLSEFINYIDILWKKCEANENYDPKKFMKLLKEKYEENYDYIIEKEPIIYLNNIFEYINDELNEKDKDIEKELINFKNNSNDEDFINYYSNEFIKKNNSIISKLFYGIFIEKYICNSCGESHLYKKFKYIDLNITKYSEYLYESEELDNSLVYYYLDDLTKFYFTDENRNSKCQKCNKKNKIIKKIIKFPDIIIFRINWGQFSKDNGFDYEEKLKKEKKLILEYNKLIFTDKIELTDFNFNQNNKKEYIIRSIINYPILNDKNKNNNSWKKYITFSRHIVDDNYYSYQPGGNVSEIKKLNRKKFVPSVLFYEKLW